MVPVSGRRTPWPTGRAERKRPREIVEPRPESDQGRKGESRRFPPRKQLLQSANLPCQQGYNRWRVRLLSGTGLRLRDLNDGSGECFRVSPFAGFVGRWSPRRRSRHALLDKIWLLPRSSRVPRAPPSWRAATSGDAASTRLTPRRPSTFTTSAAGRRGPPMAGATRRCRSTTRRPSPTLPTPGRPAASSSTAASAAVIARGGSIVGAAGRKLHGLHRHRGHRAPTRASGSSLSASISR